MNKLSQTDTNLEEQVHLRELKIQTLRNTISDLQNEIADLKVQSHVLATALEQARAELDENKETPDEPAAPSAD